MALVLFFSKSAVTFVGFNEFSQISILTTLCEKSVFYSALVANPSTGNTGTVEALLTNIESNLSIVSFFDESSTLMGSFGLKKGGDELNTGPDGYDRTLTSNRLYIDRPQSISNVVLKLTSLKLFI
ncbi:hypothetical protein BpHYR1_013239 [Brachionus plicatilis]|uniref:Uncharacterized protein n=1 Tax=Brachionus plicatilis TaxID=10195 RepID=A0A3M7S0Y7_BRAPC|nr:hypothetical protein BpHYR1_013239 [Brachionus plicatilis]